MTDRLTLREIAVRLGVKYTTLTSSWSVRAGFPAQRGTRQEPRSGRLIRTFDFREVEDWITQHRAATAKPRAQTAPNGHASLAEIARDLDVSVSTLRYAATLPASPKPIRRGKVAFFPVEAFTAFFEARQKDAVAEVLPRPKLNTAKIVDWTPDNSFIE